MNDPGPSLPEPPWTPAAVAGRGDKQETICCEPRHFLSENKNFWRKNALMTVSFKLHVLMYHDNHFLQFNWLYLWIMSTYASS